MMERDCETMAPLSRRALLAAVAVGAGAAAIPALAADSPSVAANSGATPLAAAIEAYRLAESRYVDACARWGRVAARVHDAQTAVASAERRAGAVARRCAARLRAEVRESQDYAAIGGRLDLPPGQLLQALHRYVETESLRRAEGSPDAVAAGAAANTARRQLQARLRAVDYDRERQVWEQAAAARDAAWHSVMAMPPQSLGDGFLKLQLIAARSAGDLTSQDALLAGAMAAMANFVAMPVLAADAVG